MYQPPTFPEFLAKPGQRPGNCQAWFEDFLMYGEASGWSDWTDLRKTAFLMTAVGAEARRFSHTRNIARLNGETHAL